MQRRTHRIKPHRDPRRLCFRYQEDSRSGAAAVEFAFLFPLFLMLMLGSVEFGRALDVSVTLHAAIREGGRLAAQDINNFVAQGENPNDKVENDIRNFLTASGIPGSLVNITIKEADGTAPADFDLADPNNQMELFRISATVPYSAVSTFPMNYLGSTTVTSSIVFRLGRSTLTNGP